MREASAVGNDAVADVEADTKVRLQKVLAAAGIGSRRGCEEIIAAGRVRVNGRVVQKMGVSVTPGTDEVRVDNKVVTVSQHLYFMVNKPAGTICTNSDDQDRPRVVDLVRRCPERLFTVGRLDMDTEGLILVTNDGGFANRIAHPRYQVPKFYVAVARGYVTDNELAQIRAGAHFSDGKFKPHSVRLLRRSSRSTQLLVQLRVGRNREIRRLLARVGHPVLKLRREQIGGLRLRRLKVGETKQISHAEAERIFDGMVERPRGRKPRKPRRPRGGRRG